MSCRALKTQFSNIKMTIARNEFIFFRCIEFNLFAHKRTFSVASRRLSHVILTHKRCAPNTQTSTVTITNICDYRSFDIQFHCKYFQWLNQAHFNFKIVFSSFILRWYVRYQCSHAHISLITRIESEIKLPDSSWYRRLRALVKWLIDRFCCCRRHKCMASDSSNIPKR